LSRRAGLVVLLAIASAAAIAPSASAAPTITFDSDGKTAPVFDLNQATRERVFIPQGGIDQDGNGADDKVAIEIIRPKESGPSMRVPAIVDPSPYYTTVCRGNEGECIGDVDGDGLNDKWPMFYENYFLPRGYAVILAESNGTGNSDGCPLHGGPGDIAGMKSVIDWLNGRTTAVDKNGVAVTAGWHNGKSAMIGKSYDGTLTNGVAATGVSGLTTVIPISAISDWYAYSNMSGIRVFGSNYPATLSNLVTNVDRRTTCAASRTAMSADDQDETGDRNPFWEARNYLPGAANVRAAVFATHGLQDDNVTTSEFQPWWDALAARGVPRKLWLLREGHVDPFDSRRAEWVDSLHRWLDHWLLDADNGIMDEPRVAIEEEKDAWRDYADWPLPGAQATNVYLRGTTATNAGTFGLVAGGGDTDSVAFIDPTSTLNETTMMNTPTGSQANRRVFLSPPLKSDVRISGTPRVELEGALDRAQSNLGALIADYGPATHITRSGDGIRTMSAAEAPRTCWGQGSTRKDGSGNLIDHDECYLQVDKPTQNVTVWRVSRGVLDSSNRNSLTTPVPVTPGLATSFAWPLQPVDHVFPAGHQIAVVLVGNYSGLGPGTRGAGITVDTRVSRVSLPIVGGFDSALSSGAFDNVAPAETVPADVVATADDSTGAVVTYPAPGVTDDADPSPTATCDPPSGSRFPIGATTVTCTARDASGNTTIKTFTVTVAKKADETPPQDQIPDPPAPEGSTPLPPAPSSSTAPPDTTSGPSPTLDVVDRLAPTLASLKLGAGRHALKVSFRLSEPATVTAAVNRHGSKRVLKRVKVKLGKGKRTITLRSSKLGRGRYVLKLSAVDAAGNKRNVTRTVRLR
jgi:X-Pro dipeptidyl-peptidase